MLTRAGEHKQFLKKLKKNCLKWLFVYMPWQLNGTGLIFKELFEYKLLNCVLLLV